MTPTYRLRCEVSGFAADFTCPDDREAIERELRRLANLHPQYFDQPDRTLYELAQRFGLTRERFEALVRQEQRSDVWTVTP